MKISTRTRYGTRALAELARSYPDEVVPVKKIADRQNVSAKYLEQILSALKVAGVVNSTRGVHGGYALARPPEQITLDQVFHAVEGSTAPVECIDDPGSCPMVGECPTRQTWKELQESIEEVLHRTTVADLHARMGETKEAPPVYQI